MYLLKHSIILKLKLAILKKAGVLAASCGAGFLIPFGVVLAMMLGSLIIYKLKQKDKDE